MSFKKSFEHSKKFHDQYVDILYNSKNVFTHSDILANPTSLEADKRFNADYIVFDGPFTIRIAVRVRSYRHFLAPTLNISMRVSGRNGGKSEFYKIIKKQYGDKLLYTYTNKDNTKIIFYVIIDLPLFRDYLVHLNTINEQPITHTNKDTSTYKLYDLLDMLDYNSDMFDDFRFINDSNKPKIKDSQGLYDFLLIKRNSYKHTKINDVVKKYGRKL